MTTRIRMQISGSGTFSEPHNGLEFYPIEISPAHSARLPIVGTLPGSDVLQPSGVSAEDMTIRGVVFGSWERALTDGVPTDSLVLFYNMEHLTADGKMRDFSTYSRHGTISGATDTVGRFGRGRNFSASTDQILGPLTGTFSKWTFAMWTKIATQSQSAEFSGPFRWQGSLGRTVVYWANSGADFNISTVFDDGGTIDLDGPQVANNTWIHVARTYDGSNVRDYWDGVQFGPDAATSGATFVSTQVYAGRADPVEFEGIVDEMVIYGRAMSSAEVRKLMSATARIPVREKEQALQNLAWHSSSASWQGRPASVSYFEGTLSKQTFSGFLGDFEISQRPGKRRIFDVRTPFVRWPS